MRNINNKNFFQKLLSKKNLEKIFPENFFNEINGKIIKINLTKINIEFFFKIKKNYFEVSDLEQKYDVEFIASPIDLIVYIFSRGSSVFSKNIKINGDIETANKIRDFLSKSDKFKLILSHALGDNKSLKVESILRETKENIKDVFFTPNDLNDFLIYDLKIIPDKNDIDNFLNDVDNLKSRTESLIKKYANN